MVCDGLLLEKEIVTEEEKKDLTHTCSANISRSFCPPSSILTTSICLLLLIGLHVFFHSLHLTLDLRVALNFIFPLRATMWHREAKTANLMKVILFIYSFNQI